MKNAHVVDPKKVFAKGFLHAKQQYRVGYWDEIQVWPDTTWSSYGTTNKIIYTTNSTSDTLKLDDLEKYYEQIKIKSPTQNYYTISKIDNYTATSFSYYYPYKTNATITVSQEIVEDAVPNIYEKVANKIQKIIKKT